MAVKMKASKDLKRLTDERNAAMQEYSLIMSERDTVHKEMEKLTEDLTQAKKKNKVIEAEAKQFAEEVRFASCFDWRRRNFDSESTWISKSFLF